jgi:hypothetical protein
MDGDTSASNKSRPDEQPTEVAAANEEAVEPQKQPNAKKPARADKKSADAA